LFDALFEEALAADDLVVVSAEGDDVEAYAAATERIIEEALKLADAGPRSNTEDQSVEARGRGGLGGRKPWRRRPDGSFRQPR
jgi:hypothetical protein